MKIRMHDTTTSQVAKRITQLREKGGVVALGRVLTLVISTDDAGIEPARMGLLVNTSVSRDYLEPSTASIVSGNLGLPDTCQNFDVANACLAFINGMDIAARMIERGEIDYALIVDGGRVPPGIQEVRRAALIINYTPKADRKITQRELELSISKELDNVPDIRFWFLDENGLRAISLVVTGTDSNIVNNVASELATQMKRIPIIANVISETALDRPELRIRPRAELAARLGVSTESPCISAFPMAAPE